MSEISHKNLIIETLKQHPEGLTISSVSELTGLHRHTSRKYINELMRVGEIIQRSVGAAKLCYLKSINSENKILEKRSFFKRFNLKLITSVVLITFLLSEATILAYENNSLNETLSINDSNTSPLTSSITVNDSNVSKAIEIAIENSSNSTVEINDSLIPIENLTFNETHDTETTAINNNFDIKLEYPQKITRGEEFRIKAYATNIGSSTAKSVIVEWKLPEGFEITSSNSDCDSLESNNVCNSEITVKSSLSAILGKNDVRIVIKYEE